MKLLNILRPTCLALLVLSVPAALASQQGYYRWKDDAGNEHFTQQPPAGRKSEFIAVSTGKSTEMAPGETIEAKDAADTAKPAAKPSTGPIQGVPDKDPEKCQQAQNTQGVLNSHARIREKVGDEYRYLTPEEIAEQKRLAQDAADVYCETPAQ